jgi:hypothetical protein
MRAVASYHGPLYLKVLIQVNPFDCSPPEASPDVGLHKSFGNGRTARFSLGFLPNQLCVCAKSLFGCGELRKLGLV